MPCQIARDGMGKQASASPVNSVRRQGFVHDPLEPIGNNGKNSTSNPSTIGVLTSRVSAEVLSRSCTGIFRTSNCQ